MKIVFEICIGIFFGLLYCLVYKNLKKKQINKEICIGSIIVFVFISACILDVIPIGNTTIGSVFEKEEYTEYYYIDLYDENDIFMGKYPALIEAEYITEHEEDKSYQCRNYYVNKIYYNEQELLCDTHGITNKEMKAGYKMTIYDSPIGSLYTRITKSKVDSETVDKL